MIAVGLKKYHCGADVVDSLRLYSSSVVLGLCKKPHSFCIGCARANYPALVDPHSFAYFITSTRRGSIGD